MSDMGDQLEKAKKKSMTGSLTAFDEAMKKIVATPKAEVDRREKEEKARKSSST